MSEQNTNKKKWTDMTVEDVGQLDKQYKEFAINALYGMMEGNGQSVIRSIKDKCRRSKVRLPESIFCWQTRVTNPDGYVGMLFEVTIVDGDNEFKVYRSTAEEHEIDKLHPDFGNDLWFFEHLPPKDEGAKRCFTALQANGIPLKYIDETTWESKLNG